MTGLSWNVNEILQRRCFKCGSTCKVTILEQRLFCRSCWEFRTPKGRKYMPEWLKFIRKR